MKGIADESQYSIGLLEGGTALSDVIDNHIYEQTLVRDLKVTTNTGLTFKCGFPGVIELSQMFIYCCVIQFIVKGC